MKAMAYKSRPLQCADYDVTFSIFISCPSTRSLRIMIPLESLLKDMSRNPLLKTFFSEIWSWWSAWFVSLICFTFFSHVDKSYWICVFTLLVEFEWFFFLGRHEQTPCCPRRDFDVNPNDSTWIWFSEPNSLLDLLIGLWVRSHL